MDSMSPEPAQRHEAELAQRHEAEPAQYHEAELRYRHEDGLDLPVLVWRLAEPELAISSGALGGGIGARHWVVNATVPMSYDRTDVPAHLAELAAGLGLAGPGTVLITGVDVTRAVTATDGGVVVAATVGLGEPIWAAASAAPAAGPAGTINVVVRVPARLSEAALVNAIATVAEAKAQALGDLGIPGTGTCTDATVIRCPLGGPVDGYGGPRSTWGGRLARAAYEAVRLGGRDWLADPRPWSSRRESSRSESSRRESSRPGLPLAIEQPELPERPVGAAPGRSE